MNSLDDVLRTISQAPPNELAPDLTAKVKRLIGCNREIIASELRDIKVEAEADGKASDFAIWVLGETIQVAETK